MNADSGDVLDPGAGAGDEGDGVSYRCHCSRSSRRLMLRPGWCRGSLDGVHTNTGSGMVGSPVNVRSRCCATRMTLSRAGCMATPSCCCARPARRQQKGLAASQSSFALAVPRVVGGVCMFPFGSP